MDKRQHIKEFKEIADLLVTIYRDKSFVTEIMDAVNTERELSQLHKMLAESPRIVRSEVYDIIAMITCGRFTRMMPEARILKEQYLKTKRLEDLERFLLYLCENCVYAIENWDLNNEELVMLQNAKAGDDLHIETKSIPTVFVRDDKPAIIRIYTSEFEIPEYLREKYVVAQRSLRYMWETCAILQKTLEETVVLALDFDSDNYIIQDESWNAILQLAIKNGE